MNQEFGFPAYKKNDLVEVISGKYKGKKGKILRLLKDKNALVVEKINVVKRHTKPSQKNPQGGIIEKESPIHVSKVLPISEKSGKGVRVSVWLRENSRAEGAKKTEKKTKSKGRGAK